MRAVELRIQAPRLQQKPKLTVVLDDKISRLMNVLVRTVIATVNMLAIRVFVRRRTWRN
jgi:hypothetical protein